MSALLSFLGGSAFRMVWGEVSSYLKARQEQKHETELLRLNATIASERHLQNMEATRLQADLGVREIQVRSESASAEVETSAWAGVVASTYKQTGVKFIDGWNQSIRPLLATIVIVMWALALWRQGFQFNDWDKELAGAVLGVFVADRVFNRRER